MTKLKTIFKKTWLFAAAAALIAGSNTMMAFALSRNVPANASADIAPITAPAAVNTQNQAGKKAAAAEYTVVDLSKPAERQKLATEKLSKLEGITPEQIEEKSKDIIASMTPGDKDITATQAAAYAAEILKKAYGVDFKGYTAEASFSKNPVPYSDNWTVIFKAPKEIREKDPVKTRSYIASVDSVSGKMLDASFYNFDYTGADNKDLKNPDWKNKAAEDIAKLIPENVSITLIRIISATPETGVTVVCELSDGSACAVRLTGEDKEAAAYIFFPKGYDGSLDVKPATENSVG